MTPEQRCITWIRYIKQLDFLPVDIWRPFRMADLPWEPLCTTSALSWFLWSWSLSKTLSTDILSLLAFRCVVPLLWWGSYSGKLQLKVKCKFHFYKVMSNPVLTPKRRPSPPGQSALSKGYKRRVFEVYDVWGLIAFLNKKSKIFNIKMWSKRFPYSFSLADLW